MPLFDQGVYIQDGYPMNSLERITVAAIAQPAQLQASVSVLAILLWMDVLGYCQQSPHKVK